jgi:hypothetical protein
MLPSILLAKLAKVAMVATIVRQVGLKQKPAGARAGDRCGGNPSGRDPSGRERGIKGGFVGLPRSARSGGGKSFADRGVG